jgi:hypothetical protein
MRHIFILISFLIISLNQLYSQSGIIKKTSCILIKSKYKSSGDLCDLSLKFSGWNTKFDKTHSFIEHIEENEEANKEILNSNDYDLIVIDLNQLKTRIDQIDVNSDENIIRPVFPEFDLLNSSDPSIQLKSYDQAIKHINSYRANIENKNLLLKDFESSVGIVESSIKMLHILSKDFVKIFKATGSGSNLVSEKFGFTVLDIENNIKPKCTHIKNALKDHIIILEKNISLSEDRYNNLHSNVSLLIQNDINSFRAGIERYSSELQKIDIQFHLKSNTELDEMEDNHKVSKKKLEDLENQINNLISGLNIDINDYNKLLGQFRQLQKNRKIASDKIQGCKFKCPKNYTFKNCNHKNLKAEYKTKRATLNKVYYDIKNKIKSKELEINSLDKNISKKRKQITTQRNNIDLELKDQKVKSTNLDKDFDDFKDYYLKYLSSRSNLMTKIEFMTEIIDRFENLLIKLN